MAKTAMIEVTDPVQARREVISRVLARAKQPEPRYAMNPKTGKTTDYTQRVTGDSERLAPADLGAWCDDRVMACFGSRTRLNPPSQAAFEIMQAMRSADPDAVRSAVRAAGYALDEWQQHTLLWPLLEQWRAMAPGFALDVAAAATGEAKRLGWDQRPKGRRRRVMPDLDLDAPPGDAISPGAAPFMRKR